MKNHDAKAGFTLIELLIVISIMALMTIVAMNSFNTVQKQMRVDYAADSLVSTFKEAGGMARSGTLGGGKAQCYAVKVGTGGTGSGIWTGVSDYVGVETGKTVDSCAPVADSAWAVRDVLGNDVIFKQGGSQVFYFKPPFGKIVDAENKALANAVLEYNLGFIGDAAWDRKVQFNVTTGEGKLVSK